MKREGGEEPTRRCSRLLLYRRKIGVSPAPPAKLNRQAAGRSGKGWWSETAVLGEGEPRKSPSSSLAARPMQANHWAQPPVPMQAKGSERKKGRGADRTNTPPDPSTNRACLSKQKLKHRSLHLSN